MKAVAHSRNEALRFIDRACGSLGHTWEPPQLIEIKKYKPPRSLPQNAILHTQIRELATHIGYSETELKDWLKLEYGPKKRLVWYKDQVQLLDKMIPKSTAEYTREEMSDMIAHVERIGAEMGFRFSGEPA